MKKIFFITGLIFLAFAITACEKEDNNWRSDNPTHGYDNGRNTGGGSRGDNTGGNTGENTGGNTGGQVAQTTYTITHIWECVIRRSMCYPFRAYVMRCNNGKYYYLLRYRYPHELHVGDEVSFKVSSFCENEIEEMNGHNYNGGEGANENEYPDLGQYLVASDPIEAEVYGTFPIKMCTRLPIMPSNYWCIVTTENKLLFVTPNNIDFVPVPGDRFVYNVYTLFPNSILKAKKLE